MPNTQEQMLDKHYRAVREVEESLVTLADIRYARSQQEIFFDNMQRKTETKLYQAKRVIDKAYNETWVTMRKQSKKKIPDILKERHKNA